MSKYDDYVEMCENEGTTPLLFDEWKAQRMREGREAGIARREALATIPADSNYEDPTPTNPAEAGPEDALVTMPRAEFETLTARLDELTERVAVMTTPRDPSTTPEAAAAALPKIPEPWGANGNFTYGSDTLELELTIEPGHTRMTNAGKLVNVPDKSVKFSGGTFTTTSTETRDWLESQPEFMGTGGARNPARVWRSDFLQPGTRAVAITDGPKTNKVIPQARYADRPTPLHAKV